MNDRIKESVTTFTNAMLQKLFANQSKSHWRSLPFHQLMAVLTASRNKLIGALEHISNSASESRQDWQNVETECVDIANYAMMIADNAHAASRRCPVDRSKHDQLVETAKQVVSDYHNDSVSSKEFSAKMHDLEFLLNKV